MGIPMQPSSGSSDSNFSENVISVKFGYENIVNIF